MKMPFSIPMRILQNWRNLGEQTDDSFDACNKAVDVAFKRVHAKAQTERGIDAKAVHHRLRTMVSATHGDVFFVENHGCITDGNPVQCNADERTAFLRVAEDFHLRDFGELLQCVLRNLFFVLADVVETHVVQPFDGFPEADDFGNGGRACFKACWNVGVSCLFERDVLDHFATAVPGWHAVEHFVLAVKNSDAGRAVHFVAAEREKIAVEFLHVNLDVARTLGGVNQNLCLRGELAHRSDDFCNGVHGADGVAHVGDCDHLGAWREESGECCQVQISAVQNGDDLDFGTFHFGDELPAHDIGVVFQAADDNFIAGFKELASVAPGDEIDAFGGAARKDDFVFGFCVDELRNVFAGLFKGFGGACAQAVNPALHRAVVLAVKVVHRIDDDCWLLGCGGAVQKGEWLYFFVACDQHREFIA